jgi:L-iditol 2-dehydrogenase
MDYYPGAYAEYCLGWADLLHPIPDKISFAEAAMADILCVGVHVSGRARIYEGALALCIGGGPAGLAIAQVTKSRGAGQIFVSDLSPLARDIVARFKGLVALDPSQMDLTAHLSDRRFAAIFDSIGSADTMNTAIPLLEEGGTYVNLAVHSAPLGIDALSLGSERTITTSSNASYDDLLRAFQLLNSGSVDVRPWITHRYPLEDYGEAFERLLKSPKQGYKVVFEPWK